MSKAKSEKRKRPKKWTFPEFGQGPSIYHNIFPDYKSRLVSGEAYIPQVEIVKLGERLGLDPVPEGALDWIRLGVSRFHVGCRSANSPKITDTKKFVKKLSAACRSVQAALDPLVAELQKDTKAGKHARTTFHLLDNVHGSGKIGPLDLWRVNGQFITATERYLQTVKVMSNRSRENYKYEFVFCLGGAFKQWTGKKPTVTWNDYTNSYSGKFFEFAESFFDFFQEGYRPTNQELGSLIKNIDFRNGEA